MSKYIPFILLTICFIRTCIRRPDTSNRSTHNCRTEYLDFDYYSATVFAIIFHFNWKRNPFKLVWSALQVFHNFSTNILWFAQKWIPANPGKHLISADTCWEIHRKIPDNSLVSHQISGEINFFCGGVRRVIMGSLVWSNYMSGQTDPTKYYM